MSGKGDHPRRSHQRDNMPELPVGAAAQANGRRLRRFQVGALPLVNHYLERLGLDELLAKHLPPDDVRQTLPTVRVVLLMIRNVLIARQPLYGIPEWAARYAPDQFNLYADDIETLRDDRLGGCLAKLFRATTPEFILGVMRSAIEIFEISLDELHNDSTSVSFHGEYLGAREPVRRGSRMQPAITWGHSKDHRPDLKQLLFTLTLSNDGGVPLCFHVDNGNTCDDVTHRRSWDLLAQLVGHPDFLYVADCKLASRDNLHHIAARGGRFVTILPRTRGEDAAFRQRLRDAPASVTWQPCWTRHEVPDDPRARSKASDDPGDVLRVCEREELTSDGYRLLWYHSQRKAAHDAEVRGERCQRAIQDLQELQSRLTSPRTRFHRREDVELEVKEILRSRELGDLLSVSIVAHTRETFRKEGPGRPNSNSSYRREVTERFELQWKTDDQAWRQAAVDDGVFPLITNDRKLTPKEVLEAYKRQPQIEKRFSQLKSDFQLAPVFLKSPQRVVGLFTVYFLALLVQALIERDLRQALENAAEKAKATERRWEGSVEVYPEGRRTRRPTARHMLDLLEDIHRYELREPGQADDDPPLEFHDELSPAQERLLRLLEIDPAAYGR